MKQQKTVRTRVENLESLKIILRYGTELDMMDMIWYAGIPLRNVFKRSRERDCLG